MYYVFTSDISGYAQARDTDLKSTDWDMERVPTWNEGSSQRWCNPPFSTHGYPCIATSETPITPESHPELFI